MLKIKIITKNKIVETDLEAKNITIPTPLGPAGVLNDHDNMVLLMDLGISYVECANEKRKYLIKKGVCKILDNNVTLLCDSCEIQKEIDLKQAIEDKEKFQKIVDKMNIKKDEYQESYQKLEEAKLKIMMFEK
ncbi:MAG: hypothetical protein A2202_00400 [Bdellovibrionales bacterium RIFOXYA1_FULL_36_14]|nr:MAG: hypothetical protein A2202_00400 [Bdellovibrionales bacterium RIFOXYA1_FULL_36_14]